MRCPNCGSVSPDDVKFCQRCGAPLGAAAVPGAPGMAQPGYYQPQAPPPAKKSMVWVIVVVVIAIVVILAVVGVLLVQNFFHEATNQDIEMRVTGVNTPGSSEWIIAPSAGDRYAQLTLSVTNNGQILLTLANTFFTIDTSAGTFQATNNVDTDSMGTVVYAGGTTTYLVSFEVPLSATLDKVIFSSPFGSAEANVP